MKFQNKGALLVQIAPLFISQPRNQNQSILAILLPVKMNEIEGTRPNSCSHAFAR